MPDVVREAELAFKRAAEIFKLRTTELRQAAARLVEVALEYRASQRAIYVGPLDEATQAVVKARRDLRDAEHHRELLAEQASWWEQLASTRLPSIGQATRVQLDEVLTAADAAACVGDDEHGTPPNLEQGGRGDVDRVGGTEWSCPHNE